MKIFWTNKKFVYLIFINKLSWYHSKITYENIVQKDMNKFFTYKKLTRKFWRHKKSCKDFAQHKSAWNQQEVNGNNASWLLTSSKVISLIYDPQLKSKHLHTFINLETFSILWIAQTKEWEKISCSIVLNIFRSLQ